MMHGPINIRFMNKNVQEFCRFSKAHAYGRRVFVRAEALKDGAQNG